MAKDKGKQGKQDAKGGPQPLPKDYQPTLKKQYLEKISGELREEFQYASVMQVPKIEKIVVSAGVGEAINDKKLLDATVEELSSIAGQRAVRTRARKSIANFKLRKGMDIGAMVTLRDRRMWEFLDRLINVALPRVRDFRGINPNAFDGHGNYSLGIEEQTIFPEIDYDKIERVAGLNVAIVTTAEKDEEARSLLTKLGMPFRK